MTIDEVIARSGLNRITGNAHWQCPFCQSAMLTKHGTWSTLLGGGDGTEDGDPNHRSTSCTCKSCKRDFSRHARYANVWYEDPETHILLAGVAGCWETFHYPCSCSGVIRRTYTELDGVSETKCLSWRGSERFYRTFWKCDKCSFNAETKGDY